MPRIDHQQDDTLCTWLSNVLCRVTQRRPRLHCIINCPEHRDVLHIVVIKSIVAQDTTICFSACIKLCGKMSWYYHSANCLLCQTMHQKRGKREQLVFSELFARLPELLISICKDGGEKGKSEQLASSELFARLQVLLIRICEDRTTAALLPDRYPCE